MHDRSLTSLRLIVVAAAAIVSTTAPAQSLQALYDAAREHDTVVRAARAQAEAAQHRAAQSLALRRPSAALTANAARNQIDAPASPLNPAGGSEGFNTTTLAISARQPLFNRANDAAIGQAGRSLEVAVAGLALAEQDLILRLSQAYFDVLAAEDNLRTARAGKQAITEQLAAAKRNFELGTTTVTDTREAQARFDLAAAQEIAAENDLRTKQVALEQVVGRAQVQPRPLATPVVLPQPPAGAAQRWASEAEAQHPSVRKAALALDIARLETDKARAAHLPTIDLVGSVGSSRNASSVPGTARSAAIGVQLSIPLYAGHSIQNRVKETLALEERARNDLDGARRAAAQSARTAYLALQSGTAQARALEAAEVSSQLALEATQVGYRVGVRVNLDVLNAQSQLFQTRRDLARARYEVLLANLRLAATAGRLAAGDVATIDALLAK
ncbi:MAG: TolC family outer membrane protein [Ideonella sp.]|nr:TolC family outer membrane protein [Ideonella sp.]MCC7459515.1 TolC family outer membrane protein [Nitrospira sp.]